MNYASFSLITVGLIAGILSGLFGIGGGIIIVPMLVFVFGFNQYAAVGTSLIALLLPVGLLAVVEYYRMGKIGPFEIRSGLWMALGLFAGALVGAKLAQRLPEALLRKGFAILLVYAAVRLFFKK